MSEFTVTNQSTGRKFEVQTHETILDSILREGFAVPYSCRNGTCAACKSKLISGKVVHDNYDSAALTDKELADGAVLLCRAHPTEDAVIEADEISILTSVNIQKLPCRVKSLTQLAHDVMEVKLALPRQALFNYIPGQYIDVILRDGKRRGFSLANPPGSEELVLHVRHVPKGRFTSHIFQSMKIRDVFRFEGPLGTFFLRKDSNRPIIMVAGGTGFAPLKAILEDVFVNTPERPIHLFWGARAERDLYQLDMVSNWCKQYAGMFKFTAVLSEASPDDGWHGESGWVHDSVLFHYPDLSDFEVYASGPPPMIDAIRETFTKCGLDADYLFYDSFEFSSDTLYPADEGS